MAVVAFDYNLWAARFSELAATVNEPLASAFFAEACVYCNNTDASAISDAATRRVLLNLLVAHIAALNAAGRSGSVGRVSSVTEGSVTIATEFEAPGSQGWYAQTSYGAQYWAMTASYRTMVYVAPNPTATQAAEALGPWGALRWPH